LPSDHIVVPSFAHLCAAHDERYRFVLRTETCAFWLNPVPGSAPATIKSTPAKAARHKVTCHIDCWHTHGALEAPVVELLVEADNPPSDHLLIVSARPLELPANLGTPSHPDIELEVPASISQMQADNTIRSRICSPTALAMALSAVNKTPQWQATIDACYDPLTRAYGAWPLAIRWAGQQGVLAAVEALSGWRDAVRVLEAGSPLVCSIRFEKDALNGAPLTSTSGHLVLLYGIKGDYVYIKDPAAARDSEVDRRYRVDEFSAAWLQRRGAAYIFTPGPSGNRAQT
jgi:hypothetical protein